MCVHLDNDETKKLAYNKCKLKRNFSEHKKEKCTITEEYLRAIRK